MCSTANYIIHKNSKYNSGYSHTVGSAAGRKRLDKLLVFWPFTSVSTSVFSMHSLYFHIFDTFFKFT